MSARQRIRMVAVPPLHQRADVWDRPCSSLTVDGAAPTLWLLGAHGGAGVTALTQAWRFTADCARRWPMAMEGETPYVAVVARATVDGLAAADALLRQHCAGMAGDAIPVGLVVVAARPGRWPTSVRRDLALYSGLVDHVWRVGWCEPAIRTPLDQREVSSSAESLGRQVAGVVLALRREDSHTTEGVGR